MDDPAKRSARPDLKEEAHDRSSQECDPLQQRLREAAPASGHTYAVRVNIGPISVRTRVVV